MGNWNFNSILKDLRAIEGHPKASLINDQALVWSRNKSSKCNLSAPKNTIKSTKNFPDEKSTPTKKSLNTNSSQN